MLYRHFKTMAKKSFPILLKDNSEFSANCLLGWLLNNSSSFCARSSDDRGSKKQTLFWICSRWTSISDSKTYFPTDLQSSTTVLQPSKSDGVAQRDQGWPKPEWYFEYSRNRPPIESRNYNKDQYDSYKVPTSKRKFLFPADCILI